MAVCVFAWMDRMLTVPPLSFGHFPRDSGAIRPLFPSVFPRAREWWG